MTGTGNASVNFFKSSASARRSSCRSMPQQWGTSRGASSTSSGSAVLYVPITSSAAIPMRKSSRPSSPLSEATTTCFGGRSALRPSVNAISTTGTIDPRRLKIPIKNVGDSGTLVRFGQSTTSSTSSTEKQNLSRPVRKTQYCRSGAEGGSSSSCSASDTGSSCSCSGIHPLPTNFCTAPSNSSLVKGFDT